MTEARTLGQSDWLLQASRRVDWRFLLPDPNLGRVAYVGPARLSLLESLPLFCMALTVIESAWSQNDPQTLFDVVVVSAASDESLQQGAALVRPGGFLYVEAHRHGRRFPASYVSAVQKQGFAQVETHWHWPTFETCAEMIPLNDGAALAHALRRHRSSLAARLKSAFGLILLRLGLLAHTVPCFSIVARREVLRNSQ